MRKITQEELNVIIENHQHWLKEDCDGCENMKADLSDTDLRGADLSNANLFKTDLSNANLSDTDLSNANLTGTNLGGADLSNADLRSAYLSGANLRGAYLISADLRGAYLISADLSCADLSNADLSYSNLSHTDLTNVKGLEYELACPETGSFIGYKKCIDCHTYWLTGIRQYCIVTLEIPEDAKRSSATSNKCRCNKAKVLSIETIDGQKADIDTVYSRYDNNFTYKIGETVSVDNFDDNRWNECAPGIHFFMTKEEAIRFRL